MRRRPKSKPSPAAAGQSEAAGAERLQKVLAAAGIGSRRDCEELIREGRVEVDGQVVTELGTRVNPLTQEIRVDSEPLRRPQRLYFAVNKPPGVVTTNRDPSGRTRVIDLIPTEERVFAVGRLDRASEGLILVTNDGEFANRITHPRYGVEKTYLVRVAGAPEQRKLDRLKKGVYLAEGVARAQSIVVKKRQGQSTDLIVVLNEGRNREIRRILARIGHKVVALRRIAVGRVKLGDMAPGEWRRLTPAEVQGLLDEAKERRRQAKRRGPRPARPAGPAGGGAAPSAPAEPEPYLQKQALFDEPLSLEDLLRDDLDEGPLELGPEPTHELEGEPTAERGGVIDYDEPAAAPPAGGRPDRGPRPPAPRGQRPGKFGRKPGRGTPGRGNTGEGQRGLAKTGPGKKGPGKKGHQPKGRGKPVPVEGRYEQLPREDFGRKRSGKRQHGPPETGRGPAGAKGGKFRFRPKGQKGKGRPQSGEARPHDERAGGGRPRRPGKFGGKRKRRR